MLSPSQCFNKEETPFVSQEFVAVGPMSKNALKKPRGTRCSGGNEVEDTAGIGQGDATSICVAGDQCECPEGHHY